MIYIECEEHSATLRCTGRSLELHRAPRFEFEQRVSHGLRPRHITGAHIPKGPCISPILTPRREVTAEAEHRSVPN